jgi:hypothetical protein
VIASERPRKLNRRSDRLERSSCAAVAASAVTSSSPARAADATPSRRVDGISEGSEIGYRAFRSRRSDVGNCGVPAHRSLSIPLCAAHTPTTGREAGTGGPTQRGVKPRSPIRRATPMARPTPPVAGCTPRKGWLAPSFLGPRHAMLLCAPLARHPVQPGHTRRNHEQEDNA